MPSHFRASCVMALAVLSTEAWIPHGPWTQPSGSCQMTYKSGLGDNGPAYRRGCSKGVPSGAVAVHDARNQYACISRCFDAFIEGGGPLNVVLNITALWDGYEEDAAKRCHCVQNVVPEDGAVTSKSCPNTLYVLPTGCLFETEKACADAPGYGCIYTLDDCCVDPAMVTWPYFTTFFPWWACGVAIVLLLLTSLLVWVVRARVRQGPSALAQADELEDTDVEKLRQEYDVLLQGLHEADQVALKRERDEAQDGGEVPVPERGSPSEATSLLRGGGGGGVQEPPGGDGGSCGGAREEEAQGGTCPVCLEDLESAPCVRLRCGHRLRLLCVKEYVSHSIARSKIPACPICRSKILTPSLSDHEAATEEV